MCWILSVIISPRSSGSCNYCLRPKLQTGCSFKESVLPPLLDLSKSQSLPVQRPLTRTHQREHSLGRALPLKSWECAFPVVLHPRPAPSLHAHCSLPCCCPSFSAQWAHTDLSPRGPEFSMHKGAPLHLRWWLSSPQPGDRPVVSLQLRVYTLLVANTIDEVINPLLAILNGCLHWPYESNHD